MTALFALGAALSAYVLVALVFGDRIRLAVVYAIAAVDAETGGRLSQHPAMVEIVAKLAVWGWPLWLILVLLGRLLMLFRRG